MNLTLDRITQKSLLQNVYPRQADREKGLCALDWYGTGVTVVEPCLELGSTAATSVHTIADNPHIIISAKSSDWTATYIYLATSTSGDGYKLTFAKPSSVTQIKLERWDSGSGTSLGTYDCPTEWATTDKVYLTLSVMPGGIMVKLGEKVVIQSGDTTHRLTTWYLIVGGATVSCYEFHYLKIYASSAVYQHTMLEPNHWAANAALQAGYVQLAAGWDCFWLYRMFPHTGYSVTVNLTAGSATQESRFGFSTPDKLHGILLEWQSRGSTYYRLVQGDQPTYTIMQDASGTDHLHTADFVLSVEDTSAATVISATTSSLTVTEPAGTTDAFLRDGMFFYTNAITGSTTCKIHSIYCARTAGTITVSGAREVGYAAQPSPDLGPGTDIFDLIL